MKRARFIIALAALLTAVALAGAAGAQALPATPQADACTAAPISIADLNALVARGTPGPATPAAIGAPAAATMADVTATIEQSVACANANQPLRALALFTDRYLVVRFTGSGADDLGHLAVAVTRHPAAANPADRLALISVSGLTQLQDGRVSVTVETANSQQTFVDVLILANVNGRWLIDEFQSGTPAPATPSAQG